MTIRRFDPCAEHENCLRVDDGETVEHQPLTPGAPVGTRPPNLAALNTRDAEQIYSTVEGLERSFARYAGRSEQAVRDVQDAMARGPELARQEVDRIWEAIDRLAATVATQSKQAAAEAGHRITEASEGRHNARSMEARVKTLELARGAPGASPEALEGLEARTLDRLERFERSLVPRTQVKALEDRLDGCAEGLARLLVHAATRGELEQVVAQHKALVNELSSRKAAVSVADLEAFRQVATKRMDDIERDARAYATRLTTVSLEERLGLVERRLTELADVPVTEDNAWIMAEFNQIKATLAAHAGDLSELKDV